ncbi:MAG: tRNA pseudouridine(38-40) synthase TruA, partial [Sharpea porci]
MRIQCIVSYDGTSFYGWQKQPDCRSVQEVIEIAINKITGENNIIHSSGRTDAKVHASNQVFHFDTQKDIAPKQWQRAINHFLPEDVYIKQSQQVSDDFHSRY